MYCSSVFIPKHYCNLSLTVWTQGVSADLCTSQRPKFDTCYIQTLNYTVHTVSSAFVLMLIHSSTQNKLLKSCNFQMCCFSSVTGTKLHSAVP